MKTITLRLVDEEDQLLTEVELEDYAVPMPEEADTEELDNTGILKRVAELMDAVFARIRQLNAEPVEPPVHVRITIGDALFLAAENPEPTITIPVKVKIHAEA
jgi:hypothetical protein